MGVKSRVAVSGVVLGGILVLLPLIASADDERQLWKCLSLPDSTPRIDCFDKIIWPKLSGGGSQARSLSDCRWLLDDDHRRRCYNAFLQSRAVRQTDPAAVLRPPADVPAAMLQQANK
jgi:hypothetical protein